MLQNSHQDAFPSRFQPVAIVHAYLATRGYSLILCGLFLVDKVGASGGLSFVAIICVRQRLLENNMLPIQSCLTHNIIATQFWKMEARLMDAFTPLKGTHQGTPLPQSHQEMECDGRTRFKRLLFSEFFFPVQNVLFFVQYTSI